MVYAVIYLYILVYTRIYAFNIIWKIFITTGFEPMISCILSADLTSQPRACTLHTSVLQYSLDGYLYTFAAVVGLTWRQVSDIRWGGRPFPPAGH